MAFPDSFRRSECRLRACRRPRDWDSPAPSEIVPRIRKDNNSIPFEVFGLSIFPVKLALLLSFQQHMD
jgi:hypothetical protein